MGKSYAVDEFGRRSFHSVCAVNLELDRRLESPFATRNVGEICRQLEALLRVDICDGHTLLFIDEIQSCPDALVSLRAFKEQRPELHVIAAGSLLEFALHDKGLYSFPVGRVSFSYLNPMSFAEFLHALNEARALEVVSAATPLNPCPPAIHDRLLELVRLYVIIGGMPEVVEVYRTTQSILDARRVQNRIVQAFVADFIKYGARYNHSKLPLIFNTIPRLVGRKFKYSHVDPDSKARDLKQPLIDLERSGLVKLVRASHCNGIPLGAEEREGIFKVQCLDIGLMMNSLGIDPFSLPISSFLFAHEGALAEQFVGQELLAALPPIQEPRLHFWARDKAGSEAEVDFVTTIVVEPFGEIIVPIEVKAGTTGTLRSLRVFMKEKNSSIGIRISQHPLSYTDGILSVPLYMIRDIPRLVRRCLTA